MPDIDKASYASFQSDRARIFIWRASTDYGAADSILIRFGGGVVDALDMDNVKNPVGGWLREVEQHYRFAKDEPVLRDGLLFYVIAFTRCEDSEEILCSGRLYIESERQVFFHTATTTKIDSLFRTIVHRERVLRQAGWSSP